MSPNTTARKPIAATARPLRILDLFSGIGGFSLGLERTGGFKTVAFCETDKFCRRVLAKHWPEVPIYGDVQSVEFKAGSADIITGGFPCQDVSRAGKRAGLAGARSGLYRELVRALRVVRPQYAIVENVAALLADGMDRVLGDMAEIGFDAEWDCLPAETIGAPHQRDRVYIVAHDSDAERMQSGEQHIAAMQRGRSNKAEQIGLGVGESKPSDSARPDDWSGDRSSAERQESEFGSGSGATNAADATGHGCRQGRAWRPPDSFTRVRDETRRNAADPYGARLAFREGIGRDAWEERQAAQRDADEDGQQSIWPREPALLGMDDDVPHRVDRTRALGNTILPIFPELIGRALLQAVREALGAEG